MSRAASTLDKLKTKGATALYEVIETALHDLKTRDGNRRLVVFTDGRNTKSWIGDLAYLTSQFRTSNIPLISIGLRTRDLDSGTLRYLAENTGGRFVEAASVRDIASSFRTGGQELQQTLYRLVMTPSAGSGLGEGPVEIRIGGTNELVLNHRTITATTKQEGK